jgi:hypothetical protein
MAHHLASPPGLLGNRPRRCWTITPCTVCPGGARQVIDRNRFQIVRCLLSRLLGKCAGQCDPNPAHCLSDCCAGAGSAQPKLSVKSRTGQPINSKPRSAVRAFWPSVYGTRHTGRSAADPIRTDVSIAMLKGREELRRPELAVPCAFTSTNPVPQPEAPVRLCFLTR